MDDAERTPEELEGGQTGEQRAAFSTQQIMIGILVVVALAALVFLTLKAPAEQGTALQKETATTALAAATATLAPAVTATAPATVTTQPTVAGTPTPTRDPSATPEHLPPLQPLEILPPVTAEDWSEGPEDAKVVWIEYSDFQCPACAGVNNMLNQLVKAHPDDVRLVIRYFPLSSIHDKALLSAEAAEAAGAQGKFWQMRDLLFERQSSWTKQTEEEFRTTLSGYAKELGLDVERFDRELKEGTYTRKVKDAYDKAIEIGLPGTPTLFFGGQYYDSESYGGFSFYIFDALTKLVMLRERQYVGPPPMLIDQSKNYTATIKTDKGDVVIELYADKAPSTVNSFVFLAREGFYNDITFHRVITDFVAQTGDPTGTGVGGPGYRFSDEISTDLKHDKEGVVSMANSGENTNGSQFFITYKANADLDGKYTIFGQVIEGMDVLKKITPRDPQEDPEAPAGDKIETITVKEE